MFISLEGLDGSGKTSHLAWLAEQLQARGHAVTVTREPGGTPLGEKVRAITLGDPMCLETELLLMFAARRQHLEEVIIPHLAAGRIVISDRFVDSSYAFQGGGRGAGMERVRALDTWCGGPRPQLTFLFDAPLEIAQARMGGRTLDRFEQESPDFHRRVQAAYHAIATADPGRVVVIDSAQTMAAIRSEMLAIALAKLSTSTQY